jgi:hypothetical protein
MYPIVDMSTQNNYPADTLQHRPYQPNGSQKFASSDELIDVKGLPSTTNSRHQSTTPAASRLQRGLSIPLSKFSSNQSDDTHETSCAYPPVVSPPEVDAPSIWQRVNAIFFPSPLRFLLALLDST